MEKFVVVLIVLITINNLPRICKGSQRQLQDASLNFPGLARKYGYKHQEYNVTTDDGYILNLFRIPGNQEKAVLLMHGLIDSADTFILRGRHSLAAALADKGYDVWLGNTRGNRYSRQHKLLDPDKDKQFWNFSFHEMAIMDLKAFIDFILNKNSINKLSLIGHSQGNTLFYILGSVKPEYNEKVNVAIALGPVCYVNLNNFQAPFIYMILRAGTTLNQLLLDLDEEELFGNHSVTSSFMTNVCAQRPVGYRVCAMGLFNAIAGEDNEEFEPDFYYSTIGHYPSSTSRKNLLHLVQVATTNVFAQFDYGLEKNIEIYNSKIAPHYDLSKVTMKMALFVGRNDQLTPLENVTILKEKLPNVVSFKVMERKKFNHIDHVWGKHMYKYLFPHIFNVLDKYS